MSANSAIQDDELHAYADEQLPAERAEELAAAIARDPSLGLRVAEIRRQNALLRDAFEPWLAEPLPRDLLASAARRRPRQMPRWLPAALGVAASLLIGVGVGWYGRGEMLQLAGTPVTFPRQAALTHALYASDANRPVEIWAAEEQRMVSWLSKRLGFALHAPDLNGIGFSLVGGRLVAGNEKPGALFMYENADHQRISLLVRKDSAPSGETAFRYAFEDGVGVFYWIDDACGYAISGRIDRGQLLAIARVVYGQLAAVDATK
ncbi:MAG TPA: anti-sigma factor [Casimicrobiaceae bacterium]|nr:anti-sigma factor [Casimicrobiaceae bacterium]